MEADVVKNLQKIKNSIPSHVTLVAVSKTKPVELVKKVYDAGHKIFGENRVQELVDKYEKLPKDIQWHMIGHLQTNKVKYIVPFVTMIHSVDSVKLLLEINKRAQKVNRKIDILFEIHIAQEPSKFCLTYEQAEEIVSSDILKNFPFVNVRGLMGMATFTEDMEQVRKEFRGLKQFFDRLKHTYFANKQDFDTLSMGMTHDYQIAIEEGSTMVRIGTAIFGPRNY
jgi:hypothetical protein